MKHPDAVPDDEKPDPDDDPEAYRETDPQDLMGLELGDVYKTTGKHPRVAKVVSINYGLKVEDPTANHPQNARSGRWETSVGELYEDWLEGNIVPAKLTVKAVEDNP